MQQQELWFSESGGAVAGAVSLGAEGEVAAAGAVV